MGPACGSWLSVHTESRMSSHFGGPGAGGQLPGSTPEVVTHAGLGHQPQAPESILGKRTTPLPARPTWPTLGHPAWPSLVTHVMRQWALRDSRVPQVKPTSLSSPKLSVEARATTTGLPTPRRGPPVPPAGLWAWQRSPQQTLNLTETHPQPKVLRRQMQTQDAV